MSKKQDIKPMLRDDCSVRYLARVTIELQSAMHNGSGNGSEDQDTSADFQRDANGVPTILGTSITGVIRHSLGYDTDDVNSIFGYMGAADSSQQGSRLDVSFGYIHDSKNQAVYGIGDTLDDPVLIAASQGEYRDRVALNEFGTTDLHDSGYEQLVGNKFDKRVVQAGHRFTFELEFSAQDNDKDLGFWQNILNALNLPLTRFGADGRNGLGMFKVTKLINKRFNLNECKGFDEYCEYDNNLRTPPTAWQEFEFASDDSTSIEVSEVALTMSDFWMIAGGVDDDADMAPVSERRIQWSDKDHGSVSEPCFFLPGSSIKGVLRHRALFHACKVKGTFLDDHSQNAQADFSQAKDLVCQLFGSESSTEEASTSGSAANSEEPAELVAGNVWVNEIYFGPEISNTNNMLQHVAIDKFTQGALDGALFNEKPLFQTDLKLTFFYQADSADKQSNQAQEVLQRTIDDLLQGRLGLGGGFGRGHGFAHQTEL